MLDERRMVGGRLHGLVNGQPGRWTIWLAMERYRHHLCPYLPWNTCSVVTMLNFSTVNLFLVEHGFSNCLPYCCSVVIAVVCICVYGGRGRGVGAIGVATTSENDGETCS